MENNQLQTKILVVDDSEFMRQYISTYLHDYGFTNIEKASDGRMALHTFRQTHPDVVLLDLIMPVESGSDALGDLVREGANVIVISAVGQEKIMNEMLEKGAKGYFVKPFFSSKEIGDKIIEILTKKDD